MDDVVESIKCPICLEQFPNDIRTITCGHSFCFECIANHFEIHDKNCAPCPVCRTRFWPRNRDVNNLAKNFIARQIADEYLSEDRSCETNGCDQDKSPFLCLICRRWLCDECATQLCIGNDKKHNVYKIEQIDPELFDIVKRSRHKKCYSCRTHDVGWYCPQCSVLVCELCKFNRHPHHKLKDIDHHASDTREDIKKTIHTLQQKQQEHKHNLEVHRNLQSVVSVELFDTADCQRVIERCERDIRNCDKIVKVLTQLLQFASDTVLIVTYLNLQERISTEHNQDHSLKRLWKELSCWESECHEVSTTCVENNIKLPEKRLTSDVEGCQSVSEESIKRYTSSACENANCIRGCKATMLCLACIKWICDYCSNRRCNLDDSSSNHEVLAVRDMDLQLYDVILTNRSYKCAAHSGQDVTHFCTQCNVPVCKKCQASVHLDHTMADISDRYHYCCIQLKKYDEKLQSSAEEFRRTKQKFCEIQQSSCNEVLNPSYIENVIKKCKARINSRESLSMQLKYLDRYGYQPVVVDMYQRLQSEIDNELKICPTEFTKPLCQLMCYVAEQPDIHVDDTTASSASNTVRVTESVHAAVNGIPSNPNASEESNASAHIGWFASLLEMIKRFFRLIGGKTHG